MTVFGADMYSYRKLSGDKEEDHQTLQALCRKMRADGAVWMRATLVDEHHRPANPVEAATGIWLEGCKARPDEEPVFNPPLTHAERSAVQADVTP